MHWMCCLLECLRKEGNTDGGRQGGILAACGQCGFVC